MCGQEEENGRQIDGVCESEIAGVVAGINASL